MTTVPEESDMLLIVSYKDNSKTQFQVCLLFFIFFKFSYYILKLLRAAALVFLLEVMKISSSFVLLVSLKYITTCFFSCWL